MMAFLEDRRVGKLDTSRVQANPERLSSNPLEIAYLRPD